MNSNDGINSINNNNNKKNDRSYNIIKRHASMNQKKDSASYRSLKLQNKAREQEEKRKAEQKKSLMVLILRHLLDNGYTESVSELEKESGISLSKYDAADNINLKTILIEFEEYYQMKFDRKPKYIHKNINSNTEMNTPKSNRYKNRYQINNSSTKNTNETQPNNTDSRQRNSEKTNLENNTKRNQNQKRSTSAKNSNKTQDSDAYNNQDQDGGVLGLKVKKLDHAKEFEGSSSSDNENEEDYYEKRMLKPISEKFGFSGEMKDLANVIQRDIVMENPNVHWEDVAGLKEAKQLLKESVVMPIKYPQFFQGILCPWKGVLLYGPPGTGKTLLARCVASECKTTFFNISASSIVSKWRGDSEKLVRVLFELARFHAPSTIFLDELDAIMGQRDGGTEHEGSRRMKTELMIQMDGLAKTDDLVFVLAASNLPWDLDAAILRRLEKRILVDLPSIEARKQIVQSNLEQSKSKELDYDWISRKTEGYSGADLMLVCKESAMRPVRLLMQRLEEMNSHEQSEAPVSVDAITMKDVKVALECTRPSAQKHLEQYKKWQQEFGSNLQLQ